MMTTLAEIDLTLDNDTKIGNQIWVLVATRGDGTPLCPTSFTEEDVVVLCLGLVQEHPEGVLWLSDTKAVLPFQWNSDVMTTTHHLTVDTVWHGKPTKLHILPPKSRQVSDYVAMCGSHLSGA